MKKLFIIFILMLSLSALGAPLNCTPLSSDEAFLYERINEVRGDAGLTPFYINDLLSDVARNHSLEMLTFEYFDHISPVDGSTPYDRVERSGYYDGYSGMKIVSENIGLTSHRVDVDFIVNAWMESEGHAQNILSRDVNEVGVGIVVGNYKGLAHTALYTIVFAYHAETSSYTTVSTLTSENSAISNSTFQTSATTSTPTIIHSTVTYHPTTTQIYTTLTSTQRSTTNFTNSITVEYTSTQSQVQENFQIKSNSTIDDFLYDSDEQRITFNVSGLQKTVGFCNTSIPKNFIEGFPIVLVDGIIIETKVSEDAVNYYAYFTYNHSIHQVVIEGSNTIPDLTHTPLILLLTIATITFLMYNLNKREKKFFLP